MIDFSTALKMVEDELDRMSKKMRPEDKPVIVHALTMERDFGWVFFYESERYFVTNETIDRLAGNAPFLVDKQTGLLHSLGTGKPVEEYIQSYLENKMNNVHSNKRN